MNAGSGRTTCHFSASSAEPSNSSRVGHAGSVAPVIVYVAVPTVPTLPATSVARCSSVWSPGPDTVMGGYVVHAPLGLSSRYSSLSIPDPPSLPATVTCTGPADVPPFGVAVEVGAILSILTSTVLSTSTLPSASVDP